MTGGPIRQESERIAGVDLQSSAYGLPIPIVHGTTRVSGNLLWYSDFKALAHTSSQGGKGGPAFENTTYTYSAAMAFGLCEGPVAAIGRVWLGKEQRTLADLGFTAFLGTATQGTWGWMDTAHPAESLEYRRLAYTAAAAYDLGTSASIGNHSFEISGPLRFGGPAGVIDANPRDSIVALLTDPHTGAGWPAGRLGDLGRFADACAAYGLFVSLALTEQRPAAEIVQEIIRAANAQPVFSEGVLKIVPYADQAASANGVTYTPDVTPLYDLDDDDFIVTGPEDPVRCVRRSPADAFNQVTVEYLNRANDYNAETAEAKDQAAIELFGLRPMQVMRLHCIQDRAIAQSVADHTLRRVLYLRNTYQFRLAWTYAHLEPMDLVTLTDPGLGLVRAPVRILEIEESEDGLLQIDAEEVLGEVATAATYASQQGAGYTPNLNAAPGNASAPVVFEPPFSLTNGAAEVWVGASGGPNWGGAHVWVSRDGTTYTRAGTISARARHGTLTATLAAGADPDTAHTLAVDTTVSAATLLAATTADADALATLCWVGGELIAYRDATLTSAYHYDLGYLRRGCFQTAPASHPAGTAFIRLDGAPARIPYFPADVGSTLYVKLQSFNLTGGGLQDLSGLTPFTYLVVGARLLPVPGLALARPWDGPELEVQWDRLQDAQTYTAKVYTTADTTLRRTVTGLTATRFRYTAKDATADGGPWRALTIEVTAHNATGASVAASQLAVANAVPAAPATPTLAAGASSITLALAQSAEPDVTGMIVWAGTATAFAVDDAHKVYDGPDITFTLHGVTGARYFRAAYYDAWGKTGLNTSAETSATPGPVGGIPQVTALPANPAAVGGLEVIYHTTQRRLYRWDGDSWEQNLNLVVLANEIYSVDLKAISANIGDLFVGAMVIDADGTLRSQGATSWSSGVGLWSGYVAGAMRWRVGDPAGNYLGWDGSGLTVRGSGLFTGALSVNNKFDVDVDGNVFIRSAASGARLEIRNNVLKVYDAAGTLRVKLGDLT